MLNHRSRLVAGCLALIADLENAEAAFAGVKPKGLLRVDVHGMKTSYAVIPGIRQVSKSRLQEQLGQAPGDAMARIGAALALYLGD